MDVKNTQLSPLLIGWVLKERRKLLSSSPELFAVSEREVVIRPFNSVEERTQAFRAMTETLRREGAFPLWQDEIYAAKRSFGDDPLFYFNRGVGSTFGLSQYATHLNGFVRNQGGGAVSKMWIAKRSKTKNRWPGRLDTIVGGGLPANTSAFDNMVKESQEEAGLDPGWTQSRLVSTGSISYLLDEASGLQNNTMFIYDLELPVELTPCNTDNEVESFELWSVHDVIEALRDEPERFKPDICLVLLDFCIRHGVLTPDNFEDFQRFEHALRDSPWAFDEQLLMSPCGPHCSSCVSSGSQANQMVLNMAKATRRATTATPAAATPAASTSKPKEVVSKDTAVASSTRLYVQNLPAYVDTKRLRDHFASQGEVTDAVVIKTKDGSKSRRFGFVGYKTEQQATQARAFFDHSFLDTCRLNVTFAVTRDGDNTLRPWSKYSSGSSRFDQQKQETEETSKPDSTKATATDGKKRKGTKTDVVEESSAEFQEFLETMQARSKSKFWANDDVQDPALAAKAAAEASKLLGDDSDDDDDVYVVKRTEEVEEEQAMEEAKPQKEMSDLDFLRSKVNKKLDKEEDKAIAGSNDDDDDVDMESDSDEEESKPKSNNADAKPQNGAADDEDKPTARLFVRNLPFTAVEEDLTDLFSGYGEIVEVHMPLDETKRRKGFGFVLFRNTVDAQKAMDTLNGFAFQGRRLHIIYARVKPVKVDPAAALADPNLTYKQKKELERQLQANKQTGWNASYIRGDATVGTLAERMGVKRGDIMDRENGNMAVRLAIGETMLVKENKEFFAKEGVDLDAIEGALVKTQPGAAKRDKIERSTTVILVKNLPHTTDEEELAQLFRKHGDIGRFLLAPSKTLALVEFFEPSEARKAFRSLAYKKFQHVPLYLEWAPVKVFTSAAKAPEAKGVKSSTVVPGAGAADDDGECPSVEANSTICVKNLNFDTKEAALEKLFRQCGKVRKVTVARRKDPKRGMLSMGFGFVEFADAKQAEAAIKTLQSTVVDGHALNLRISQKKANGASSGSKRKADEDETTTGSGRKTKLIVRNVAFEASSNEIRELFGAFGQLKRVRMPKKFDGKHRGFAFVEFLTEQEAQTAFASLASSHLYGRHLVLEWAEDADDMDTLRAKASRDLSAINESDRRKRQKQAREDAMEDAEDEY
ncbi:hypothetical protein Poli38472_004303 [Pythium oligandrum]|uniref:Multiple RNA-binding domain-containing protein 1 n=1 Tax=Pythium oligandrum TaxID=41045 RepID=A0A8K1FQF1_PYTOL|nr:hypothetical protein Poli38472_004303 [Pythium oligandrum]|eukprot:TMW66538.1 hypothetical protein Poli38472_004303 [Pythium oligandrum]